MCYLADLAITRNIHIYTGFQLSPSLTVSALYSNLLSRQAVANLMPISILRYLNSFELATLQV